MELPRRERGDELLEAGAFLNLRERLRLAARKHDLSTVIACAFDYRTRMLPFFYADTRMAPAGVRAIGSALVDAGFHKTRIVLQQWNKHFRPQRMRLDGNIPDIFMVSSMQVHSSECHALIRDACHIAPAQRPLIIVGGPKAIYEPWDVFGIDPNGSCSADVAVTGEEYVLLSLLEVLLRMHRSGDALRATFLRARDEGVLDGIPGLVYPRGGRDGHAEELIDTGIQRLVGDLDELPSPVLGYRLLEPPGRKPTLGAHALADSAVSRCSPIGSLVLTFGCKFACPYCPIPAYNQRQYRVKSGERIAEDMSRLYREFNLRNFLGADDNFFNDHKRSVEIATAIARTQTGGVRLSRKVRWATEATIHDTLKLKDDLPLFRDAGLRALWLGVEDMTATLINKGQSIDKTSEAFRALVENDIAPMPMMMHHDEQPLYSAGSSYGLLNQVSLLRRAGASSLQVLMMSPATGSKLYAESFSSGLAYESVGGKKVLSHMLDANYVIASRHRQPWRKQLNLLTAYLFFYNPFRLLGALARPKSRVRRADIGMQVLGMFGVVQNIRRTFTWALRLMLGEIKRKSAVPHSRIPMQAAHGGAASHALPGTQLGTRVPVNVEMRMDRAKPDAGLQQLNN
jgi:radical SAM superfamily enzyme YgiQ (UPF0313 family)